MSRPEGRTDRAKMLHLQQAVLGREWDRTFFSNVSVKELKYQTLIERLEYSLQQCREHQEASIENFAGGTSSLRSSRGKSVNFAGQARYAREPQSRASIVSKHHHRSQSSRTYPKDGSPNFKRAALLSFVTTVLKLDVAVVEQTTFYLCCVYSEAI